MHNAEDLSVNRNFELSPKQIVCRRLNWDRRREEWRNGNYPGYKHTNPDATPFEDKQSDGKPGSFLQAPASPAPAGAPGPAAPSRFNLPEFKGEWREEWR